MKSAHYRIWIIILSLIVAFETFLLYSLGRRLKQDIHLKTKFSSKPKQVTAYKARIAIVLDDWGYNLDTVDLLNEINIPLTISVLPELRYSQKIARDQAAKGRQIILHLPMEPYEKLPLEQSTILTSMDNNQIRRIINTHLNSIPYLKGVSNHMGSKATSDRRVMRILFEELKKRNLYFLDSFVSPKTVAKEVAKELGLSWIRRDVFLDNKLEKEYIKGQLLKLKSKADIQGQAVGIGHARRLTLQVLKETTPEFKKQGYRFVLLSELLP